MLQIIRHVYYELFLPLQFRFAHRATCGHSGIQLHIWWNHRQDKHRNTLSNLHPGSRRGPFRWKSGDPGYHRLYSWLVSLVCKINTGELHLTSILLFEYLVENKVMKKFKEIKYSELGMKSYQTGTTSSSMNSLSEETLLWRTDTNTISLKFLSKSIEKSTQQKNGQELCPKIGIFLLKFPLPLRKGKWVVNRGTFCWLPISLLLCEYHFIFITVYYPTGFYTATNLFQVLWWIPANLT